MTDRSERSRSRRPRPSRTRVRRNATALLPQLLRGAVEIDPTADALVSGDRTVSYGELDRRSSKIARVLIAEGVGPEDIVAIAITRSVESVVALWSVAKTGAAFVPVDPTYPADRVLHMLTDSGAQIGVTTSTHRADLPGAVQWTVIDDSHFVERLDSVADDTIFASDRVATLRTDNLAYLIYTSGSTGIPKGVAVTHSGLADLAAEQMDRYELTPSARTLHFASPSFDASILELLLAIAAGSTMVIAPSDLYGGDELGRFLHDNKVTHAFVTPAALASVDPSGLDSLETVSVGGESVPPELLAKWGADRRFLDVYGPTEATVVSTMSSPLTPGDAITIGDAIAGSHAYVLDQRLRPVPTGVAGELYLGGAGVARGYHGKQALTSTRFVPNPFADSPDNSQLRGTRMYRTGDMVRRNSSGSLEYVARNDSQVKVRGFRIELGEVDTVLTAHPSVAFAVTVGQDGPAGDTVLVSYVRAAAGAEPRPEELASFAAKSLPKHMIPSSIMIIDAVPLTPSGKLDRDELPDPEFLTRQYRAPETDTERAVATVFAEILGADRVGLDDDFFELGGNSLSATRLAARIGAALDLKVGAREVFADSTVRGLAAIVDRLDGGARVELTARPRPDRIPLSYAQQRMWFLNRFDESSLAYNVPIAIRLTGDLDRPALEAAIADLVVRHEVLRTVYPEHDGTGYQKILSPSEVPNGLDIQSASESDLIARITDFIARGFDVTAEIPFRASLFTLGTDDAVLVLVAHHIAVDGFSIGPLTRDLMTAYAARMSGDENGLPSLEVQYADFALWQREALGSEDDPTSVLAQQLSYWSNQLAGLPEVLELPTDRPRPTEASDAGAAHTFVVEAELATRLHELARSRDATLFMVTSAALAIVLAKTSGTSDIAIGTAVAGRGEEALDELVGMFVNTLVLRSDVADARSLAELIDEARTTALDAFAHADVPFERLVEILDPPRSTAHTPLFQVMLTMQNLESSELQLPGLRVGAVDYDSTSAKFDLALTLTPSTDGGAIGGTIVYATDLFDETTVAALAERFVGVLRLVVDDPERRVRDLDLRSSGEISDLARWNATDVARTDETVLDAFDRFVETTPNAPAVTFGDTTLNYAEFGRRVDAAAHHLVSLGVGPETAVAVVATRSLDMLTGIYAVLRAGGAYVPLDPSWPHDRIAYVLDIVEPVIVLGADDDFPTSGVPLVRLDALAADADGNRPDSARLRPDNVAYTIFTSGSTGRPKGVSVSHRAIVGQLQWLASEFEVGPTDAVLQKTAAGFDASVWELLLPLSTGARLVLADPEGHRDPRYMANLIAAERITIAQFVPSVLALMAEVAIADELRTLRAVLVGGEQLDAALASDIRALSGADVHNVYGPTETTVQVTHAASGPSDVSVVPIGTPVFGARLYVLDGGLNEVPVSVVGELYVGGDQLARGYMSRPDLTSERFVADPFVGGGSRLYRTGDLVRRRRDGSLVYVGRSDAQVKVNGLRVELGEIESALRADASVSAAAASVVSGVLVGYVVPAEGHIVDEDALREHLSTNLPGYMIPTRFMVLEKLPSNASGKLDRRALPAPSYVASQSYRAPETDIERVLVALFAEVLGRERIGLDDSFFAMGGDSIMSIQLVSRAQARGLAFRPRDVFEAKTVGQLSQVASWSTQDAVVLSEIEGGGVGTMPTTPIVEAMIQRGTDYGRFTQSVALELPTGIDRDGIVATIAHVVNHHDMLRSRLDLDERVIEVAPPGSVDVDTLVLRVDCAPDASPSAVAEAGSTMLDRALGQLDPSSGAVLRFVWIDFGPTRAGRILVVAHHLVVDGVSWRILVPDFVTAWAQHSAGGPVTLAPVGTSMRTWAHAIREEAASAPRRSELDFWQSVVDTPDPLLGSRAFDPTIDTRSTMESVSVSVPSEVTDTLLTTAPAIVRGGVNDVLLTALAMAVTELRRRRGIDAPATLVSLEGHGREEDVVPGADLSRTVGWFTTVFPVALDLSGIDLVDAFGAGAGAGAALKIVKENLARIPDKGIGFGLLRHLDTVTAAALQGRPQPQIGFNYLGRVGAGTGEIPAGVEIGWVPAGDMGDIDAPADDLAAVALVDVNALVTNTPSGEQLEASFAFASRTIAREDVDELAQLWVDALDAVATYSVSAGAGGLTPSDVPLVSVSQADIDRWEAAYGDVEDIWPLTPLQQGLQFHALAAGSSPDVYMPQIVLTLGGDLDASRLRSAAEAAVARHDGLRTVFVQAEDGRSAQLVRSRASIGWNELDLSAETEADRHRRLQAAIEEDRSTRFDLVGGPLLRFTVIRLSRNEFRLIVTDHHIVLDGWSMPILLQEILALYALRGDDGLLPRPKSYRSYLSWLGARDITESLDVWSAAMAEVQEPTFVAGRERVVVGEWAEPKSLTLGPDETSALTATAARLQVTMNTLVQAAWAILLARTLDRTDVVFGATVSGRPAEINGVEGMVGLFINTIPVRVHLEPDATVASFLERLQREQVELLEHHHVGLADITRRVGAGAKFDTLTVFESYPVDGAGIAEQAASIDGLTVLGMTFAESTHYPVTLRVTLGEELNIRLEYMREVVPDEVAHELLQSLERVLSVFGSDPDTALRSVTHAVGPLDIRSWPASPTAVEQLSPRSDRTADVAAAVAATSELLGLADVRAEDNLFDLGAGSLDALALAGVLTAVLNRRIPLASVLSGKTIEAIVG
ncbi:non-ribosomal peptide synthetase [Rhodococcoides kyotonense]|uniref:non-ribosomal peptide synthetase n=1 Tax=Rhodococcoides kyotonense TaxID=398843 RepID=UPI0009FFAC14|nr:non-ribosomal peptide synthetase [Rhodococcus kyotonensis]